MVCGSLPATKEDFECFAETESAGLNGCGGGGLALSIMRTITMPTRACASHVPGLRVA